MNVSSEIVKRVEDKILEVLQLLQKKYNTVLDVPKYSFRQLGVAGGLAYLREYRIELNSDFFTNHSEDMINQTVPHEIAHLVAFKIYGPVMGGGHGRGWKSVMNALSPLGVKVSRCHSYSLEGVKNRRRARPFIYKCNCQQHGITLQTHNKIVSSPSYKVFCRTCKVRLVYVGPAHSVTTTENAA